MKKLILLNMILGASLGTISAQGQPAEPGGPGGPEGPGGPGRHRPPPPILVALDANHDGVLDAGEIANASTSLKTLDKNGDGQLTADELRPQPPEGTNAPAFRPPPPPAGRKHPVPPIMAALDTNGDGILEADEIANASAALLKLDKNGDGKLTRDELRPQGLRRPPQPPPDAGSGSTMTPPEGFPDNPPDVPPGFDGASNDAPDGPADLPPPPDVVD